MKSVTMSNSGFLSPVRKGKMPDARTPPPSTSSTIAKQLQLDLPPSPLTKGSAKPKIEPKEEKIIDDSKVRPSNSLRILYFGYR